MSDSSVAVALPAVACSVCHGDFVPKTGWQKNCGSCFQRHKAVCLCGRSYMKYPEYKSQCGNCYSTRVASFVLCQQCGVSKFSQDAPWKKVCRGCYLLNKK